MEITQAQLAAHLGVSTRGVEEWEGGRRERPAFLRLALERLALTLACGSNQPWLADYPIHRDARQLMKISNKPNGDKTMRAMYIMNFIGQAGAGQGAIYIGDGVISGIDVGEVVYDGTYNDDGQRFRANATMKVPSGTRLVTGQLASSATSLQITADWPSDFGDKHLNLMVAGQPVNVVLKKLRELPN